jgi:hypothetical protein
MVRDLCADSRLPDELIDDALLVTSQLVTSSVKRAGMAVEVVVTVDADTVTVRVQDDLGTACPSPARGWKGASRSQDIIARRSTSWGYYRCGSGRETWASFRAQPVYITIQLPPSHARRPAGP